MPRAAAEPRRRAGCGAGTARRSVVFPDQTREQGHGPAFKHADSMNWRRLMWANDFPHSDSTWPWSQDVLDEHTKVLSAEQQEAILCGNVADLYGIDVAAQTGTPVISPADGVVLKARFSTGYGNMVEISHGYGVKTLYAHNSRLNVKAGQRVKRGDVIAFVGDSGSSTGPHLHYEVRVNGLPVNPGRYMK